MIPSRGCESIFFFISVEISRLLRAAERNIHRKPIWSIVIPNQYLRSSPAMDYCTSVVLDARSEPFYFVISIRCTILFPSYCKREKYTPDANREPLNVIDM